MYAFECCSVLTSRAMILAVGAGHEPPVYCLTNRVRWVFATDLYGSSPFGEADATMLSNPDAFAEQPYNRRRLVVEHMDAMDLRFEDATFDAVFSLSAIEHIGGVDGAKRGLREMVRVTQPGGVIAVATEIVVNNAPHFSGPGLEIFTAETLSCLWDDSPAEPVEPFNFTVSPQTVSTDYPLADALRDTRNGKTHLPHILLNLEGRRFTSVFACLRKLGHSS